MGFNKDDPEAVTASNICVKRHNTVIQLFRHRLEKPFPGFPRFCLHYPDFAALRTCDNSNFKHSFQQTSWSVLKRICTIFKVPTVSCCTGQMFVSEENVDKPRKLKMLEAEVEEFIAAETGRERIIRAWNNRLNDQDAPADFRFSLGVARNISFVLFLYKFFQSGMAEGEAFKLRNRTTLYGTKSLAVKRFANAIFVKALKDGISIAVKGGSVTFVYILMWRGLCLYYNTSAPWTVVVASATMLSLIKTWLGPRAMLGGAIFGAIFGGIGGTLFYGFSKTVGCTQQEFNYQQVKELLQEKRSYRSDMEMLVDDEDEKVD